jgi:hypothetical protein
MFAISYLISKQVIVIIRPALYGKVHHPQLTRYTFARMRLFSTSEKREAFDSEHHIALFASFVDDCFDSGIMEDGRTMIVVCVLLCVIKKIFLFCLSSLLLPLYTIFGISIR